MALGCCTIADRQDHVQYLTVSKSYSRPLTCSMTEQNIALNDHNDAMGIIGIKQNTFVFKIALRFC